MDRITVIVDDQICSWVDTIMVTDECQYTCAVLVNTRSGQVYLKEISQLTVVDERIVNQGE